MKPSEKDREAAIAVRESMIAEFSNPVAVTDAEELLLRYLSEFSRRIRAEGIREGLEMAVREAVTYQDELPQTDDWNTERGAIAELRFRLVGLKDRALKGGDDAE